MKKLISIFALLFILGCAQDEEFIIVDENQEVPEALVIDDLVGIKLASSIVSDRVAMNVKLSTEGSYRVKIRHSMTNELISQEKLSGKEGDNILKVYVNTLENSSYKLELAKEDHTVIGITVFSKF
jgi:uncharacterized lipoprotein YajG